MIYRVVKEGDYFFLEGSFPIGWIGRLFRRKSEWHWIHTYESLEDAIRGRDFLLGSSENVERVEREVVA